MPYRLVALQQLVGAQQQFGEVDHALALALRLVLAIQLDALARVLVPGLHCVRPQARLLLAVNEVGQVSGRKLFVVDVEPLQQALDGGQLVGRIEDLEQLRQAGIAVVGAQQAIAQAVESADPHAARVDGQHGREAGEHLLRRLVGEGDGEYALRADLAGLDQPGDARGEYARLARAGTGKHQGMLRRQGDGGELGRVEPAEQVGHGRKPVCEAKLYFLNHTG